MKKNKLTFGLIAALLSIGALTACNEVTEAEGVVLSYKDASGNVIDYTAAELFDSYQVGTSVASTNFQKIKEVLIRKYYESGSGKSSLESLKKKATNDVDGYRNEAKNNAKNNNTDFATEWEKILTAQGAENYDELFDKMLFKEEESDFKLHGYYGNTALVRNQLRDGKAYQIDANGKVVYDERGNAVLTENDFFPASDDFGRATKGYLEERMPYHVTHVLIGVSGASETNATSITISAEESKKLGEFLKLIATSDASEGGAKTVYNTTFNLVAKDYSADTGSGENYGDLGIMDFSTSFVQGFQYGLYSYDAHFNTTANAYADAKGLRANLLPSQGDDVKYYNKDGERVALKTAFQAGGVFEEIGEIPFGAALALANEDVYSNFENKLPYKVNDGEAAFYPRNIIFNKYFNTHKIAVITPDSIPFNAYETADGHYVPNADEGAAKTAVLGNAANNFTQEVKVGTEGAYLTAAYPGFSRKVNIGGAERNVLTTEKGQVVLAVRGDSGTPGVHFIVVDRSPLSGYGTKLDNDTFAEITEEEYLAGANSSDVTSLSEYYSMLNPVTDKAAATYASADAVKAEKQKGTKFPFYAVADGESQKAASKTTFVNSHFESDEKGQYTDKIRKIEDPVSNYNSSLMDGYTFQQLFKDGSITFNESNPLAKKVADLIESHSKIQRESAHEDNIEKKDEAWTKYIEFLIQEEVARGYREEGDQKLISETCAIGYLSGQAKDKEGLWAIGGACHVKK